MSNYVEVVTAKSRQKGKSKISTLEIRPNEDGFNVTANYEDGDEPNSRKCKSLADVVTYVVKLLDNTKARPEREVEE